MCHSPHSNLILFLSFFFPPHGAVYTQWLQMKVRDLFLICMHAFCVIVTLEQKCISGFRDLLRPPWIITLRKQLAKLWNWKVSKQQCAFRGIANICRQLVFSSLTFAGLRWEEEAQRNWETKTREICFGILFVFSSTSLWLELDLASFFQKP